MRRNRQQRGQVTVEVGMLFVFVIAAMLALGIYLQRATQGGVKSTSDSIGTQFSTFIPWTQTSHSSTTDTGTTVNSTSNSGFDQTLN